MSNAGYAFLYALVLGLGALLLYLSINRIGNDLWGERRPDRSWDAPATELVGGLLVGLGGGGLLGLMLFHSAWIGAGLGLLLAPAAAGWIFWRRSEEWAVRSIEDTMDRPAGLADYVGRPARALESIAAGSSGAVSVVGPDGDHQVVMAVAEIDVAKGSVLTVIGRRGLNPLVAPPPSRSAPPR